MARFLMTPRGSTCNSYPPMQRMATAWRRRAPGCQSARKRSDAVTCFHAGDNWEEPGPEGDVRPDLQEFRRVCGGGSR